ncbi:Ubiquitin-associated/translation elongation factor EF1B, N-terminal, eukaryote [Phytophthora cinnamomi]|uniref:Ubiquitin-associated/translation elongation factor EF1B, N-terminal, eukaryote n=1 Tax=Phytophthora cinnamomi TaxID=4785 RepID=UPI00355982E1|nr:Ubiquitin-associated/translation elongation factor EF1B, N-terminal, eukaryote [Phytophthora cinnamomi]
MTSSMAAASRQIQVLLTLLDGERSFGMSLAQKSPALGPKYTVVSSVFANSPADRAGVRKGYVVRCINDRPMNGLTVAQVANHFRNASQAKITLEVVENSPSPRTNKGKGKAKARSKKAHKQQANDDADTILDDDEVLDMYALSSDSDSDESPSKKTARRAAKGRRRGATDRTRHSLTVDRLVGMGFTKEDAEASVREIGDDPDACMIWIISKIEERQFTRDLNEASIQSEQSKRDEEKRVKKIEMETLVHAEKFMSLFPSSYIACPESSASNLKRFLHSTIDQVDGETYIRKILTKLLTLEGKSIRWYKQAVRSYMLELSGRLDAALGTHDVMTCCARISSLNADPSDISCNFMRKILEEEKALTKALFEMPTNQGGVPQVFLECDETTKFDLDDDGFEVVEPNT